MNELVLEWVHFEIGALQYGFLPLIELVLGCSVKRSFCKQYSNMVSPAHSAKSGNIFRADTRIHYRSPGNHNICHRSSTDVSCT